MLPFEDFLASESLVAVTGPAVSVTIVQILSYKDYLLPHGSVIV